MTDEVQTIKNETTEIQKIPLESLRPKKVE